ncbi:hypothetical protein [Leptospira interrogans]|uniref:hypothetical protein n=1 Tax=Leptospira interrogans TaxID=173 RepID=UPI00027864BD|nr:hypothetical protein [Leptospira interrogans]EJP12968.1 hypothetical protein LEP1GSC080_0790 [Leptospira interrogans str. FPW2026]
MSAERIELNWIHRFLKFPNRIPSYFAISFHWIKFSIYIPALIEDIQDNGLQILNLKIRKGLSRKDPNLQFLFFDFTIINVKLFISFYSREGFFIQIDSSRFPRGLE